jgi:hypothetical protein
MPDVKKERRTAVRVSLDQIANRVNSYLRGEGLDSIEPILGRIGRNRQIPYWYQRLRQDGTLPNLDGKTIGSVVEMLIVADIERNVLTGQLASELNINPAKGVDVPDLDLGIKSPSENWCTSEPFSNAYERLLGTEFDIIAVITDYQTRKDKGLCACARTIRPRLLEFGDAPARKAFRFLAYAVQSEWICKKLVGLMCSIAAPHELPHVIDKSLADFDKTNRTRKIRLADEERELLVALSQRAPLDRGIIDVADDWVVEKWKEAARLPNDNEWQRLQASPLDGKLGVSFALQWRYNFGVFFRGAPPTGEACEG